MRLTWALLGLQSHQPTCCIAPGTRAGLQQSCSHRLRGGWRPLVAGNGTQAPPSFSPCPPRPTPRLSPAWMRGKLSPNLSLDPSQAPRTERTFSQPPQPQFVARKVGTGCWGSRASLVASPGIGLVFSPLHTFTHTFTCARVHGHTHSHAHTLVWKCKHTHVHAYTLTHATHTHTLNAHMSAHSHSHPHTTWWTPAPRGPWAPLAARFRRSQESGP